MCCLSLIKATEKLKQQSGSGAFEQLFGPVRGEFEQKFSKNTNPPGLARGDVEALIWLVPKVSHINGLQPFENLQ